ncbi:beta-ketoacyl-[acyl-carrier-protein] synthase family protein [Mucisphaera sp.]|uniref:beta-ketoacyl-[acyl-carrier-protein] synthase family protein n=1 Tax=Mucisphaera sp. TaxID=2913024 RepID=UPI003D138CDD
MTTKVVVTGIGWVTPLGYEIESVWQRLLAGASGVGPIQHFDASTYPTTFASQVLDFDPLKLVRHPEHHAEIGRNIGFALGAAALAWRSAGLDAFDETGKLDHDRLGIYLGSGEGILDFDNYVAAHLAGWNEEAQAIDGRPWTEAAKQGMSAARELEQEPNMPLAHLALEFDARGPAYNCLTACAASTQAIGEAMQILRRGDADVMMTGGAHTMIHPLGVTGFNRLTALSNRNDSPATASRPFSRDRDGFVMGEGAGILMLETEAHAKARQAPILAEVAGYGSTADAYRITDIHPEGRGAAQAMRLAMKGAGVETTDIDYISAHGTSTKENDAIETKAVKAVFGEHAPNVPMSSIKSMLGHLIAAAGAIEAIACVLAIRDQVLPPTINLQNPDPDCDLDYVANEARRTEVEVCLSNSFGFGGQNDTLILRRY